MANILLSTPFLTDYNALVLQKVNHTYGCYDRVYHCHGNLR